MKPPAPKQVSWKLMGIYPLICALDPDWSRKQSQRAQLIGQRGERELLDDVANDFGLMDLVTGRPWDDERYGALVRCLHRLMHEKIGREGA